MAVSSSTVSLTLDDYNALQEGKRQALNEAADLQKQLIEAKLSAGGDGAVRRLTESQRRMLEIIRFAVGNMPPESVRGWPVETLNQIATDVQQLADATADDQSFAAELRAFARDCEKIERQRIARLAQQKVEIVDMRPEPGGAQ